MVGPVESTIGGSTVARAATPPPPEELLPNPALLRVERPQPEQAGAAAPPPEAVSADQVFADQGVGGTVNEVG